MWSIRSILLLLAIGAVLAERRRYDGYQILEVTAEDRAQIKSLIELEDSEKIEILKRPAVGAPGLILVPAKYAKMMPAKLTSQNMAVKVMDKNIQESIDREFKRLDARYAVDPYSFDINDFNRIEAIYKQYVHWIDNCPTGLTCKNETIGKTHEGRDQIVLKIGKTNANNKVLFLESILHSREWLAAATELKMIDHIITGYPTDSEVKEIMDKYDFYFLAVGNPDGYVYSWDADRNWRKNRRLPFPGSFCIGTDLNRNFEAYHGKEGASTNPCTMTYQGPGPNSEPETKNIVDYTTSLSTTKDMVSHMCIHAYGRMWMFPYGHTVGHNGFTCARTEDHKDLTRVTNAAVDALEATHNTQGTWKRGTICEVIYPATGDEISFAYDILKTKYSFALELRGWSFVVDKSQIPPSFSEVWNGVVAMLDEIENIDGY